MRSDLLQDAIGMVRDDYVQDAHACSAVPKGRSSAKKMLTRFGALAACLGIVTAVGIGVWKGGTPAGTQPPAPMASDGWGGATQYGDGVPLGNHLYASHGLADVLARAEDTDEITFVVGFMSSYGVPGLDPDTAAELDELYGKTIQAQAEENRIAMECVQVLMEDSGLSRAEAEESVFTMPEFVAARERSRAAEADWARARVAALHEHYGAGLRQLTDFGFTLLYDGGDEAHQLYLSQYDGLGVMVGTKGQIEALAQQETDYDYCLFVAEEHGENFVLPDGWDIVLGN